MTWRPKLSIGLVETKGEAVYHVIFHYPKIFLRYKGERMFLLQVGFAIAARKPGFPTRAGQGWLASRFLVYTFLCKR